MTFGFFHDYVSYSIPVSLYSVPVAELIMMQHDKVDTTKNSQVKSPLFI